jgi:uncharacterized membrane protein required for colicin V production
MSTLAGSLLFLPEKQAQRYTAEVEVFPQLIFQVIPVWRFYVIGVITEKSKTGCIGRQLGYVLDLYRITPYYRWVKTFNCFQHHIVQL